MKKILLLLTAVCLFPFAWGDDVVYLQYVENFSPVYNSGYADSPIQPKEERLNSNAGDLIAYYDESMPDSIKMCIDAAIDIWASKIGTTVPLYFNFRYEYIGGNDIVTTVQYSEYEEKWIPSALKATLMKDEMRDSTSVDAIIQISSNVDWDCSFGENQVIGKNSLPMGLLRGLSRAFGFGSSIKMGKRGDITFGVQDNCSDFDELIFSSSGQWLKDLSVDRLPDFVAPPEGENIYVLKQSPSYRLYAPEEYEQYKSLVYLDNEESLMHYDLGTGNRYLRIDDVTSEILSELGWNVYNDTAVEIVGIGIGSNGIASAYESHKFRADIAGTGNLQNQQWEYRLPLKDGGETVVKTETSTSLFEIPAIDDQDKYAINVNGDIYGKIIFMGELNGEEVRDEYRISLELKPIITELNITKFVKHEETYSYDVYYEVFYKGADKITVSVDEEYGARIIEWVFDEPFRVSGVTPNISSLHGAWIDFTVENEYGKTVETLEFLPGGIFHDPSYPGVLVDIDDMHSFGDFDFDNLEVFDKEGNYVKTYERSDELIELKDGFYILKYIKGKQCVKTSKYLKR